MTEWREGTLSDVAEIVMGQSPTGETCNSIGDGVPLLNGPTEFGIRFPFAVQYTTDPKKFSEESDILFCVRGSTTGRMNWADQKYALGRGLAAIRHKNGEQYKYFVRGIIDFNLPSLLAAATGSTFPNVSRDQLTELEILIPPPPEQKAIAAVLSSLDDKIDLLNSQNQTLEAMAATLFRQWFVEEAQEDWKVGPLKQYVDIGIGRTPPRQEHQWFSENPTDVKWISIKDLGNDGAYIFNTAEYLTRDAVEQFNVPVIPVNTVVLSFKMTVGRVAITTEAMLSNEAISHFKFRPDTPFSVEYIFLHLKNYQYELLGSTSSIVTAINSAMIKDMTITIPDKALMRRFDEVASELFKKIRSNQLQISTLESLRDNLLPKLMSGEVRMTY